MSEALNGEDPIMGDSVTPIKATTLTPFAYHSLMVPDGTATLPELIGDRAMAFALAATLGMLWNRAALPARDYRGHLAALPFRTSVFTTAEPELLPPLVRRLNLDAEAGIKASIASAAKRGNLKDYFLIQEVPPNKGFHGAVFGLNPFNITGEPSLVVRVGLHRAGMVLLEPDDQASDTVTLNAATAALFQRELPIARYCLHSLQLTPAIPVGEAREETRQWQA